MANEHNLHVFSSDEVKSRGMAALMRDVLNCIASNNNDNIHVSIDIDAMDPSLVCGTGTLVKGGLWNGDFYTFVDMLFKTNKIISTDFVEYNHLLDDVDQTTAKWCIEALHYLSLKIKQLKSHR